VIWLAQVNPLLPIIIITGRHAQRELAKKMGADALMEKPLDVARLLQTIRDLINEPTESRVQRVSNRAAGFRYVSCDHELFREMLHKRSPLPTRVPG
jgi:DNA-binding response OmpR family regulator